MRYLKQCSLMCENKLCSLTVQMSGEQLASFRTHMLHGQEISVWVKF